MSSRVLGWVTGFVVSAWVVLAVTRGLLLGNAPLPALAPYIYVPLLVVAGAGLAWLVVQHLGARALAALVLVVGLYVALGALLTSHPGRGTIGYANANAALGVQLLAAAAVLTLVPGARRLAFLGVAAGMLSVIANASEGGLAMSLIVVAALGLVWVFRRGHRRWPAVVASLLICGSAVATLMHLARSTTWPEWALNALDPVRQELWHRAWATFRHAERLGYGPGGYAQANPLAGDDDTMAAHSLPLHVAAELGGAGLIMLTLLFLCGLAWAASAPLARASWIAIAAWTALAGHSFMDHLLEYWPVPLAAGLVIGAAWALSTSVPAPAADAANLRTSGRST